MGSLTLVAPLLLAASKKTTSSSGSATFLIVILIIGLGAYFFFLRPQQQRARRQRQQHSEIGVGDEILTVGGIVGRVVDINSDHVTIVSGAEVQGPGALGSEPTRLVLVRNAIARKIEPPADVSGGHDVGDHWGGESPAAAGPAGDGAAGGVDADDLPGEGTGS